MKHHEKVLQEAQKVAAYITEHPGCTLTGAATALCMKPAQVRYSYLCAVRQGFVELQKFRQGPKKDALLNVERVNLAAGLRRQGKTLKEIGQELGVTRERARQILMTAIDLGKITEKAYGTGAYNNAGARRWQYFLDLASHIEDSCRNNYPELLERHFPGKSKACQNSGAHESVKYCIDSLVENNSLSRDDAAQISWLIGRLKIFPTPLRMLKRFSKDAVKDGMTRKKLAFKYGMASRNHNNPANSVTHCLQFAIELGLIDQDAYNAKAIENKGAKHKYSISAIEDVIREHSETGQPYAVLARKSGIPAAAVYNHVNKK